MGYGGSRLGLGFDLRLHMVIIPLVLWKKQHGS